MKNCFIIIHKSVTQLDYAALFYQVNQYSVIVNWFDKVLFQSSFYNLTLIKFKKLSNHFRTVPLTSDPQICLGCRYLSSFIVSRHSACNRLQQKRVTRIITFLYLKHLWNFQFDEENFSLSLATAAPFIVSTKTFI